MDSINCNFSRSSVMLEITTSKKGMTSAYTNYEWKWLVHEMTIISWRKCHVPGMAK